MERFPYIHIEGEPVDRGRQYGAQAADQIRFNLAGYWRYFEYETGLRRGAAIQQAQRYVRPIQEYAPELLEEMRGIAQGAGVTPDEVLALNCRTEILSIGKVPQEGECTAIYVAPETSETGGPILAQNWDWAEVLRGGSVLLRIQQPGRPTVLTLTEAGMVGKIGLNSAGVGVCTNFLRHSRIRPGVPFHVLLRKALNAERLGLAVAAIYQAERADSGNYLLGHAAGEAIDLEATSDDIGFIYPADGCLVHTNHFLTPRLQSGDQGVRESDNTLLRYGRASHLITLQGDKLSIQAVRQILQDHVDYPKGICRHPDPSLPEIDQTATLASMILDLAAGEMSLACGEPCRAGYYTVSMD